MARAFVDPGVLRLLELLLDDPRRQWTRAGMARNADISPDHLDVIVGGAVRDHWLKCTAPAQDDGRYRYRLTELGVTLARELVSEALPDDPPARRSGRFLREVQHRVRW